MSCYNYIKSNFFLLSFLSNLAFISYACNKKFTNALKNSNNEDILKVAKELEEVKKYDESLQLYEHLISLGISSELKKEIDYKKAWINYYDGNYILAAQLFKHFHSAYPSDKNAQEALFQSAYCYFLLSSEYNLDQKETYEALEELQSFLNYYPTSIKVNEVKKLIKELEEKVEKKYFYLAKNYLHTLKYKEAIIAIENFMSDFPLSIFKEEALFCLLESKVKFALESSKNLKEKRKLEALSTYKKIKEQYPNSKFIKEALKLINKLK